MFPRDQQVSENGRIELECAADGLPTPVISWTLNNTDYPSTIPLNSTAAGKGSPYSIAESRVPELNPVLGSQPAGDVSHKPGGRLLLLSARSAVTLATLKRAAASFAAW